MSFQIRQATILDLDTLAPLFDGYRQFYRQPADLARARDFLAERFRHHESLILLARDEHGAGLGFTQLYPLFSSVRTVRTWLLNDLFVVVQARRQGVASALLRAAACRCNAGTLRPACRCPPRWTIHRHRRCTNRWAGSATGGSASTA